jgi:coenzyme F420-reducing hydrogenase alpha subunit
MDQGRISSYQILAPTEWNFHPQGLVKNSLCHLSINHPQQLEKLARLLVNAIDPCVGYDLRIL